MKQFKALSTSFDIKYVVKEIEILKSLNNKYIIKYLDSFQEASKNSTTYYAVTNYYEVNSLISSKIINFKVKIQKRMAHCTKKLPKIEQLIIH